MKKILALLLISMVALGLLSGCGAGNEEYEVDLNSVLEAVKAEMGESYYPNRDIEMEELKDYTGLSEDQIEEFVAQAPMITIGVDTFIAIKATEGNADKVYEGLESYRKYLVEESFQYPMNMPKINAAKVVQYGDYSFFIMLGEHDESIEDFESQQAREHYESEVARVKEAIYDLFK